MAKRDEEEVKLKEPVAKPKKEPKPPREKDTRHGVTRPAAGTSTGKVWEHADAVSKKAKEPAKRAAVIEACVADGINASTAATQYGRWRVYNGLGKEVKEATKAAE